MPYITEEVAKKAIEQNIPIVLDVENKCACCNQKAIWTLLAIHIPSLIWLCDTCYHKSNYDQDKDFIEHNWEKIYWGWMMYKIWRGFIPTNEIDERGIDE